MARGMIVIIIGFILMLLGAWFYDPNIGVLNSLPGGVIITGGLVLIAGIITYFYDNSAIS